MRSAWPGCERAQSQGGWQSGVVSQGGSRLVWPCSQAVSSVSSTQKVPSLLFRGLRHSLRCPGVGAWPSTPSRLTPEKAAELSLFPTIAFPGPGSVHSSSRSFSRLSIERLPSAGRVLGTGDTV